MDVRLHHRQERQLRGRRLADHDETGAPQIGDRHIVHGAPQPGKGAGAHLGKRAAHQVEVFDSHRQTPKRRQGRRIRLPAIFDRRGAPRGALHDRNEGEKARVVRRDALQAVADKLRGRYLAPPHELRQLERRTEQQLVASGGGAAHRRPEPIPRRRHHKQQARERETEQSLLVLIAPDGLTQVPP